MRTAGSYQTQITLAFTLLCAAACGAPKRPTDSRQTPQVVAASSSRQKLIVGPDDRFEPHDLHRILSRVMARSSPVLVNKRQLSDVGGGRVALERIDNTILCPGERFRGQGTMTIGEPGCSAFLISSNEVATAAHCVRTGLSNTLIPPSDMRIVFGYRVGPNNQVVDTIPSSDVYTGTHVIEGAWDTAVITLDRAVPSNYRQFRLRPDQTDDRGLAGVRLAAIGYPAGLPIKFADWGNLLLDQGPVMRIGGIDTAAGNSGSVVLDVATGDAIGIVTNGPPDYGFDDARGCAYELVDDTANTVVSKINHVSAIATARSYGSCAGFCGDRSVDGCYCDAECDGFGDCCADKAGVCTAAIMASPCINHCGEFGAVSCDIACESFGDCSPHFLDVCGNLNLE